MRVPQVSERIKEAPAQALRGVFAGIGQLLLITDKLRNKAPGSQQDPQTRAPKPPETAAEASRAEAPAPARAAAQPVSDVNQVPETQPVPQAAKSPRTPQAPRTRKVPETRDLDKSGNVRLLDSAEGAEAKVGQAKPARSTAASRGAAQARSTAASRSAAQARSAREGEKAEAGDAREGGKAEAGEAAAPLPGYDELSVASLRARLRYLDVDQLRQLADYEKAHADRAEVITMFERRIAKLEAESTEGGEAEAEAGIEAQEEVGADVQAEVAAEAEGET
jgi:hypothetical protein